MYYRTLLVLLGLSMTAGALAQDAATSKLRRSMVDIAGELLATVERGGPLDAMLGIDSAARLRLDLDDDHRENWQYWPTARAGLSLENMSARQRMLVHDLLTTIMSSAGYLKVVSIMQLEQILDVLDRAGLPRSVDHYVMVVFGTPSMDSAWAWRFEGHHVSLNVSVSPDGVSVTPSFLGSNPAEIPSGPLAGFRVHGIQEDLARDLLLSLTEAQRATAIVGDQAPSEIFSGNIRKPREQWNAWRETLRPAGIAVAELNESQRHWVRRILEEAVANYRPEIAEAVMEAIDLDQLRFAWMGGTARREAHYFRVQGPDFMFEYDNSQNMGNHVHAVWRSVSGDFGQGILERHYQSSAH